MAELGDPLRTMIQRLSPLHQKHVSMKATMTEQEGGWLWPEKYNNNVSPEAEAENALRSLGVSDISPLEKLDIKGANIDSFLKNSLGIDQRSPGSVSMGRATGIGYVCRLTADHALAVASGSAHAPARSPLEVSGFPTTERCYLTNVTSVLAGLNVLGPAAPAFLSELTQIDLAVAPTKATRQPRELGWCTEAGVAKVRAVLIRSDIPAGGKSIVVVPSFDLFFGRDYAEYLWDAMIETGARYSISPFGSAAHRLIHATKQELAT